MNARLTGTSYRNALAVCAGWVGMAIVSTVRAETYLHAQLKLLQSATLVKNTRPIQSVKSALVPDQVPSHSLNALLQPNADGFSITYPWSYTVPAAAFYRGSQLWVVFGAATIVISDNVQPLNRYNLPTAIATIASPRATIIGYTLKSSYAYALERSGNVWRLDVKKQDIAPRYNLIPEHTHDAVRGDELLFRTTDSSSIVSFHSSDSNDDIMVAPLFSSNHGVLAARALDGATLLKSAQGIAIVAANPHVELLKVDHGIAITTLYQRLITQDAGISAQAAASKRHELIDLDQWVAINKQAYADLKSKLLLQLSMALPTQRQAKRWQLARLYLANEMPQESLGALAVMLRYDHDLLNVPKYRAIRGVAALKAHQFDNAEGDLKPLFLDGEPQIWLWRSLVYAHKKQYQMALDAFSRGSDAIGFMKSPERINLQLSMIDAAINIGNQVFADKEFHLLPFYEMSASETALADYYKGKLLSIANNNAAANTYYNRALAVGNRRCVALATLAHVQNQIALKTVSPQQAIIKLERLRFSWRSSEFELELLSAIAGLYEQTHKYREALNSYRQAAIYFPNSDETRSLSVKMDSLFRKLFLDGMASEIAPVQALALYNDFQDLTPLGNDGDMMIRLIANRLVDVGLYDRASGLLEHQVKYRLEGTAQAAVAVRLAMVELLNHRPDKAIDALRATRQLALPEDVRDQRNLIEARALADSNRIDEAMILIDKDHSRMAEIIRADIYWRQKNWSGLIAITQKLSPDATRIDLQKHVMRLAFAYTMLGDSAGSSSLRSRYAANMTDAHYNHAFQLLTSGNPIGTVEIDSISSALASVDSLDSTRDATLAAYKALKT